MGDEPARTARRIPTAELLPPVPLLRCLLLAALVAQVLAYGWAMVEVRVRPLADAMAVLTGGVVGLTIVRAGGHGSLLSFAAGALTVMSIATGKWLAFGMATDPRSAHFQGAMSFDHYLTQDFRVHQAMLWLVGVSTAAGIVARQTTMLRIMARAAMRAQRDAAESP